MIISKQQGLSDVEEANKLMTKLDTLITVTEESADAYKTFQLPHTEVTFFCEGNYSAYTVRNSRPVDTSFNIIFAPKRLEGNSIITWTKEWGVPYKVGSFLFLANEKTKYYFIDATEDFLNDFPPELVVEVPEDVSIIPDQGYEKYKFITFSDGDDLINSLNQNNNIKGRSEVYVIDDLEVGEISYYERAPFSEDEDIPYLGEASVMGVIISEDREFYECTMMKALKRLELITNLTYQRTYYLYNNIEGFRENCEQSLYAPALADLLTIESNAENLNGFPSIHDAAQNLAISNEEIIRDYDCPLIY
jgi:hypothetical protein